MSTQTFLLPDVGEGLTEAEIVTWRVAPGDEARGEASQADAARPLEIDPVLPPRLLLTPLQPVDLPRSDAVFVLQEPAQPDGSRHGVLGHSDPLAAQIFRPLDRRAGMDKNTAVAEGARGKDRDGYERPVSARGSDEESAHGKLRHIEFLIAEHAPEDLLDGKRQIIDLDPLRLHRAVAQSPGTIIVFAS